MIECKPLKQIKTKNLHSKALDSRITFVLFFKGTISCIFLFAFIGCQTSSEKLFNDKINKRNDSLLKKIDCDISVIKNLTQLKKDNHEIAYMKIEYDRIGSNLNKIEEDGYAFGKALGNAVLINDRSIAISTLDSISQNLKIYKEAITTMEINDALIPLVGMTYCYYNFTDKVLMDMRNIIFDESVSLQESYQKLMLLINKNSDEESKRRSQINDEYIQLQEIMNMYLNSK